MQGILFELLDRDWRDITLYTCASVALAFLYKHICQAASIKRGNQISSDIASPLVILQGLRNLTYIYIIITLLSNVTHIYYIKQLWIWKHITFCTPAVSTRLRDDVGEKTGSLLSSMLSRRIPRRMSHMDRDGSCLDWRIWTPHELYMSFAIHLIAWPVYRYFDCFSVQYHYPERVTRQYGLRQTRPDPPEEHRMLHDVDRRGKPRWIGLRITGDTSRGGMDVRLRSSGGRDWWTDGFPW